MIWKKTYLLFYFFIISISGIAQYNKSNYWSAEIGIGSMIIPENKSLLNDYIPNLELSYGRTTFGKDAEWIRRMRVSYTLLTLTYMNQSDLNGIEVNPIYPNAPQTHNFGNVYMLTYSLMINLLGKENRHFYFIPGWGLAYDTKTYYDDPMNIYIGTHLNYAIRLEGMFSQKINDNNTLLLGIKYMHYSNGSWTLPNRGINSATAKIGLAFNLK